MRAQVSQYCARLGRDPLLVQGAGGNVSWKEDETLWIKASGTWLRDADKQDIFVPVALPELQSALRLGQFDVQPRTLGKATLKPSIETVLHALLPHKFVVHVHAIEPLSWLVRADAASAIQYRLPASLPHALIDYCKPGRDLAQAISDGLTRQADARVVLLMNHGIVVAGDTLEEVQRTLDETIAALCAPVQTDTQSAMLPTSPLAVGEVLFLPLPDRQIQGLAQCTPLWQRLQQDWALCPDHVVFLGAQALLFDDVPALTTVAQSATFPKDMPVFVKGLGAFSLQPLPESKQAQLRCYHDLIVRTPPAARLHSLRFEDIAALLNWDAERYRQQLNK